MPSPRLSSQAWLNVDRAASVEVTSEESGYPIESALQRGEKQGWRAATAGTQVIRLIFDEPQKISASGWFSKTRRTGARKNSRWGGLRTPNLLSGRSYISSGILSA